VNLSAVLLRRLPLDAERPFVRGLEGDPAARFSGGAIPFVVVAHSRPHFNRISA